MGAELPVMGAMLVGASAVVGSLLSPFLSWKGGKGVATTVGVILAFEPWLALLLLAIWGVGLSLIRSVGIASVSRHCGSGVRLTLYLEPSVFQPILINSGEPEQQRILGLILIFICSLIVLRHRSNIREFRESRKEPFNESSHSRFGNMGDCTRARLSKSGSRCHDPVPSGRKADELRSGVHSFLPDLPQEEGYQVCLAGEDAPPLVDLVISAIPTQKIREYLEGPGADLPRDVPWISASKGLERGTKAVPTQILQECGVSFPPAVLSGPSHAEEV